MDKPERTNLAKIDVLDHGYVQFIEHWGSDERVIESARMSTNKGFQGWDAGWVCSECGPVAVGESWQNENDIHSRCGIGRVKHSPGDAKLLAYLWKNHHATPFEMAGLVIEVKAPIFVFREWHRHRTQSYNEMSARYIPLPDENYMPTLDRIADGARLAASNRQAQGLAPLDLDGATVFLKELDALYQAAQGVYARALEAGVPKELARLPVPVARYSRMRASANLRNWLAFLTLRTAPNAQWEIRQYANAVAQLVAERFPRTHEIFAATSSLGNEA
jgi:thymidylate synthase (FAD)